MKAYARVLEKHPWKTQMIQTGVLMGFSDYIAQTFVEKKKFRELETGRMVRFALIGTLYVGPALRVSVLQDYKTKVSQVSGGKKKGI